MIKCEKFYLCLCDDWIGDDTTDTRYSRYLTQGYTDYVQVPLVYCNDTFGSLEEFPSRQMLLDMHADSSESKRYFFSPLHFNDRCLGYSIICNSDFSPASCFASTEFRTSYGLDATCAASSFGGLTPANGLIFITTPFILPANYIAVITKGNLIKTIKQKNIFKNLKKTLAFIHAKV